MAVDRSLRPLLAFWIREIKMQERAIERAREDGEKWFRRAKLALDAGKMDMASYAKEQAVEARDRFEKAKVKLAWAQSEKDLVRLESDRSNPVFEQAQKRAEHTLEEFRRIGIDPEFARLAEKYGSGAVSLDAPLAAGGASTAPAADLDPLDVDAEVERELAALGLGGDDDLDPSDSALGRLRGRLDGE